jgi:fermentation-respiration switch protein FrsA (DUF1100 family)
VAIAGRLIVFAVLAYAAILALLYSQQSRLIYPAPQDVPPLTPGYTEVFLQTDDGLSLRAFYQEAWDGLPTVLYFHGNGGTLAGASVSNRAIAEAGVGVLLVEYRGYGGNAGEPSEEGFYRDADAALRWLEAQEIAPTDTVVIGNSIGSGSATYTTAQLVQRGSPPAALILIAPFTSLPEAASDQLWWLPVHAFMRDTFPNQKRLEELSQVPVLIQHGTEDNVVGYSHGQALAQAYAAAEFQSFEGSGHALSFEQRSQKARLEWITDLVGAAAER